MGDIKIGDLVRNTTGKYFVGRSVIYSDALLVSLDPIILVSLDYQYVIKHIDNLNDLRKIGIISDEEVISKCFKKANMSYIQCKREVGINSILYQVGDNVKLPLNEEGVVDSIDDHIPWGFKYRVKITKGTFNDEGDIIPFKSEQFI